MKRLNLMFLVIGVAIIFSGCSKDDFLAPDLSQGDQATTSLKSAKIPFTEFSGICSFFAPGEEGSTIVLPNDKILVRGSTVVWYDDATDPLVTGKTFWSINQKIEEDGTFKYWGKAELIVDDNRGRWEMSWHGYLNQDGLIAVAVGTGKEGEVKGLVAHWTYTMDFEQFVYNFEGYYK